jgi:hypothetical protein
MNKNKSIPKNVPADSVECLGRFNPVDKFCLKYCSLKLRCAIEQKQINHIEMIEDLFYSSDSFQVHL